MLKHKKNVWPALGTCQKCIFLVERKFKAISDPISLPQYYVCMCFLNIELSFEFKKGLEYIMEGVRVAAFQSGNSRVFGSTGGSISGEDRSLHTLF